MWDTYYLPSVLIIFLWGLWFLQVPGGREDNIGLKVKYILITIVLSVIPIFNIMCFFISIGTLIAFIAKKGWDKTFPGEKGDKIGRFFNYQFLK
jgi:hypothetical protein